VICRWFNLAAPPAPAAMSALAIGSWKLNALQDLLHGELGLTVECLHMGSTFVDSVGFFFLRLVKLQSTWDLETYSVFNMHLYELTKYSQESSPWMVKRDILCAIWSPNVCSLRCCGYSRAWTAWVIYILMYTPLSWADEVRVSSWDLITAVICYEGADSSYTFMSNSD
jgi:hypothetical protein